MDRIRRIKHIALDMDGTIYNGNTLFPFTIAFLDKMKELGIGYSFLTNNPSKSTNDYLRHLSGMGIKAVKDEFYTSAQATIDYIRVHHPECKRLFLLGTPSMIKEFEEAGFESTDDNADDEPDAVVVSFDMSLVYSRLCRAAWWINQKKLYIATNPDRVCPTDKPLVLVDCGSICSNLRADQVAMVGDRIYTDILMAQKANALGVLVLSGETTYETAIAVHPNPDLILRDLAELQQMLLLAHEID